jgi:phosphoglycolate phosphatase
MRPGVFALRLKAVIFDLDGTLLDTLEDIADSMNSVLERHGFQGHGYDAYRYFIGDGLTNLVRRALPADRSDPETVKECLSLMKQDYRRSWRNKTRPYPGITDLLLELKGRGMKMAVLSNKDDTFTKEMVESYFPAGIFIKVVGAKPDVPLKPDPTSAGSIIKALSLKSEQCLFVGDTAVDMQTAMNAGLFPLGVSWGFRPAHELLDAGAQKVIDTPAELLDLLSDTIRPTS